MFGWFKRKPPPAAPAAESRVVTQPIAVNPQDRERIALMQWRLGHIVRTLEEHAVSQMAIPPARVQEFQDEVRSLETSLRQAGAPADELIARVRAAGISV